MAKTIKSWSYHVIIAIDQLFNAITGGAADETLSSRTYRGAVLAEQPKKRWRVLYRVINGIFFDRNHCQTAYESEIRGKQHDERFKTLNKA
ncbi:DNA helicase UvrD [Aggregatibacter actinomycetemcomitans]|uniref:DNA helicase UvrD n=1 Tax=Aggregatibacter actinomycetemcomitans TaxID=714 RepID=UPI00197B26E5|nr:DNA helicase UvrD [Aggregatibacter actinomycetemcomitans]MBN6064198.1 DNA helicase UvrD [Aggregatibacter actinomycetemcomitans]MBN6081275.1 DNA helicase UvrD [Aggregatibacter actinomycetemcomitans]MBN6084041.1 DNA helicase UvrD [Aggregatibacter actinomycetemcomitans]